MYLFLMPFYLMLFIGTMITISATSWFTAWMGLEINMMAFMPLIYNTHKLASEALIKYFFIQAIASICILFTSLTKMIQLTMIMFLYPLQASTLMLLCALTTKLGAAPFHFWFPALAEGLPWMTLLTLTTWQKIAPLMLMLLILPPYMFILFIALLSALIGAFGGLNQTSLKKLLTFSSITHLSWMIILMETSLNLMIMYFFIYAITSMTIMILFLKLNILYVTQMFTLNNTNMLFLYAFILLLSLGGLPPLLGFLPKWLTLKLMLYLNLIIPSLILIITSITSLYYYLRISYSFLLLSMFSYKKPLITSMNMFFSLMLPMTLFTLPLFIITI